MNLDIGKAFTFLSDDPKWVTKLLIGGGLILAGFLAIFTVIGWIFIFAIVLGYLVQFCRNVIAGQPQPLPEWDNWGTKMTDGFKAIVVNLVYALPAILISLVFVLPGALLSASNSDGANVAGGGLQLLGNCLSFIVGLATYLVLPIGVGRYAASGNIGYALQFGEVFAALRRNISTYVIIALLSYFAVGFISGIGLLACGIGMAFTSFYASLMQYHLFGQAQRQEQGMAQPGYGQAYQQRPF